VWWCIQDSWVHHRQHAFFRLIERFASCKVEKDGERSVRCRLNEDEKMSCHGGRPGEETSDCLTRYSSYHCPYLENVYADFSQYTLSCIYGKAMSRRWIWWWTFFDIEENVKPLH
jgi:hypothetical protein